VLKTFLPATSLVTVKVTFITGDETWAHHYQPETKWKKHAMEASIISCCKQIQDTTIGRQDDVDYLLEFLRAYS
jgi:hypothetical protein